jgi:KDO2-lipid IV(A) lauroyltransferase
LDTRVVVAHPEHVKSAAAAGRGILYMTAHYGNWELHGARMARLDPALSVVAGDQRNQLVDRLVRRWRERLGMSVIPMASAVRDSLRPAAQGQHRARRGPG